jgi:hypothetical protein
MNPLRPLPLVLILAAAGCAGPEEKPAVSSVHCRGKSEMLLTTFTVEGVEPARRGITLKGPDGKTESYIVGAEVRRYSEIHPGDLLTVQYFVGMVAELREPSAEEAAEPIKFVDAIMRDPADGPPAGAIYRTVRVVTTVGDVNLSTSTMTLKGPRGVTLTVKVEETAALTGTRHGRPIIATFGEQMVLSIEPAPKKN